MKSDQIEKSISFSPYSYPPVSCGFTLTGLMIVLAIVAAIAGIGIPNLCKSRMRSWETAAAGTLRTLATTVEVFKVKYGCAPNSGTSERNGTGDARLLFEADDDCDVLPGNQDCPTINPAAAKTYTFTFTRGIDNASWQCTATTDQGDSKNFYIDYLGWQPPDSTNTPYSG